MAQEPQFLTAPQYLLTTLFVKVAVMSILTTMLVRYRRFRDLLIYERRDWPMRLFFAFGLGATLAAGVTARLLLGYKAADLTLEGAFLAGLVTGPWAGALVGLLIGAPAFAAGEFAALPFAIGCGFAGGGLREACPKETIWTFSPLVFWDLPRHLWRMLTRLAVEWQVIFMAAIIGLEIIRQSIGLRWPARLFILPPHSPGTMVVEWLAAVMCVATPIKIWNTARVEHLVREQEQMLLRARLEALSRQINPHFLFNTLASISSLVRTRPETARTLILKLSNLLRRLLRSQDHFVALREELASVDEYLDIEVVRFGPQLTVEKDIAPETLDIPVPSMLLQPVIENSIKHGLAPKVGGGRVLIRTSLDGPHLVIEIDDNGLGMSPERLQAAMAEGIGLSNVQERLRVIYASQASVHLSSAPGRGTRVRIDMPRVHTQERLTA